MNKLFTSATSRYAATVTTASAAMAPFTAFAQSDEAEAALAGGLVIILIAIGFFAFLVGIITTVFWIWMLVDSIKREYENKGIWIALIIIFGFIPAVVYYFIVRKPAMASGKTSGPASSSVMSQQPMQPEQPQQPMQ